jgi:nucleoside-diphosphate-sugar epimerase
VAQRLAVTGAGGFVGRALTRLASSRGIEVIGLARSDTSAARVEAAGGRPFRFDGFADPRLAEAFAGASAVVHLAQLGSERRGTYEAVNVQGTAAVGRAARAAGVPRVVSFSGLGVAHYGMARRTTSTYFLSKLTAEIELFRAGGEVVVYRPSYIVGPGDGLTRALLRDMRAGRLELPGDGAYRVQPIAVADAAAAALSGCEARLALRHQVFDLVGPEAVRYRDYIDRFAEAARARGVVGAFTVESVPVEEADRQAAAGGFHGMLSDELDCLLCDEVSDHRPLEALLGRPLMPLAGAIAAAVSAA